MSSDTTDITSPVLSARNRLMATGRYLGDSSISDKVQWVREGHGHVLALLPIAEDRPDATAADSCPVEADLDFVQRPLSPQCATLSAIARIDREDFWLTSDGGYQGPNSVWKEFLQVKPSCALTDPGSQTVPSDFGIILQTLQKITDKCVTPGYTAGRSFFSPSDDSPTRFKLRHKLFEGLDADLEYDDEFDRPSTDAFSMERWPLTKEKNRAELIALKPTHRILPIPAYDVAGDLIKPSAYRRSLQDAIVEVHFTMSHWGIAKAKRDVYGGEIHLIRVLVPPSGPSRIERKRRIPLHIEIDELPPRKKCSV
ncbi:hypothetical protein EDD15DRAFT_2372104 [Pisolithus albus]|nr:hypothetical protein EDD15DRAFT_2372104 [Pisolithus albus]